MDNLFGVYEKALPPVSWQERFEIAKEAGFDFIEISVDKNRMDKLDWNEEEIEELKRLSTAYEMPLQTMTLSCNRYFPIGDPELRGQGILNTKKAILLAEKLGIGLIQLTAYDVYQKESTDETKRLFREAIEEILRFDEEHGILLAIEVLEDVPHFNTSKKLCAFLKEISHPLLWEYADTGNLVYNGFDPVEDLKDAFPYMKALHIKDAVWHNEHNVLYGEGLVDFDAVLSLLKDGNYSGPLVSECWWEEDHHPDLKSIHTFIRRYMK